MSVTKTIFKSLTSEKRWIDLQKEKAELQSKKVTPAIQEKIDITTSLMTSCKIGFNLSEAKVKKITRFLKEKTGNNKIKYGTLPEDIKPLSTLFKDTVVLYMEVNGQVVFREHEA
jgi:hypothetical protein